MKKILAGVAALAIMLTAILVVADGASAGTYQVRPVAAQKHQAHIHYVACPNIQGLPSQWDQKDTLPRLIEQWYNLGRYRTVLRRWFSDATLYGPGGRTLAHIHQKCA